MLSDMCIERDFTNRADAAAFYDEAEDVSVYIIVLAADFDGIGFRISCCRVYIRSQEEISVSSLQCFEIVPTCFSLFGVLTI